MLSFFSVLSWHPLPVLLLLDVHIRKHFRYVKNFLKEIEAGKYDDAKNLLIVDGNVDGSFEDFSKAFLKGSSLTKKEIIIL